MSGIEQLLQEPLAQAIGWALLHFVWQGALVGILAAIALAVLHRSDADVRYVVGAIALAVMATLPVVTAVQSYNAESHRKSAPTWDAVPTVRSHQPDSLSPLPTMPASTDAGQPRRDAQTLSSAFASFRNVEPWIPMLVLGWLVGVAVLTVRLLSGWIWVQRMKSRGTRVAARQLQAAVVRLSKRLHIARPVRLLESARVDVPTVIGWLKPVILLPVSALAGLSQAQVEAILAHELAHIRRHDYLVNLLQALLETLLFYHPAVWWLSRRIRAERENCCDDLAVSLCGDPVAYARALADLEELRGASGQLVMAASGGPLLHRVRRLLIPAPASHDGRGPVWLAGAAALFLVFTIGVAVVSNAPRTPEVAPFTNSHVRLDEGQMAAPQLPPTALSEPTRSSQALRPSEPSPSTEPSQPSEPSESSEPTESSQPAAPAAPSAPAAPVATQGSSRGNHVWSHNGERIEIKWSGEFEFTDDDADVRSMTPHSELRISDRGWLRGRSVEFTADSSGKISRRYWVGSSERPFDPEGKQWLAQKLPQFVRESGLGAKARVARIYKARGVPGVLGEIKLITSSWAKKVYYTELLNQDINAEVRRQVLEQAGRDITSDYELATLLISQSDKFLADAGTRKAFFDAARSIDSDYEMRRVFGAGLKRGPLEEGLLAAMLDASRSIDSDYELASLLIQVVKLQSIESARAAFFTALSSVESDYDQGRVLAAMAERPELSNETVAAMLGAVSKNNSDHESANFLIRIAKRPIDGALRVPFFTAVDAMNSGYEKGRVLLAVAAQPSLSPETILAVLTSVKGMSANYEASRVLQTLAAKHAITGAARDVYIEATERLGDYEQGRALAALVRGDRARR